MFGNLKSDVLMGGEAGAWADEGVNQFATECKFIGVCYL